LNILNLDEEEIDRITKLPEGEPNFLAMVYIYFELASKYLDIPEDWL
jgi:hypothetical protein